MVSAHVLPPLSPPHPRDLKSVARRHLERGLLLSAAFHLAATGFLRTAGDRPLLPAEPASEGREERVSTFRVIPPRPIPPGGETHGFHDRNGLIIPVTKPYRDPVVPYPGTGPGEVSADVPTGGDRDTRPGPPDERGPAFAVLEVEPEAVFAPKPAYPDWAREAGVEGTVLLRALVGTDGHVRDVAVERGAAGFEEEAVRAIRRWVFRPGRSGGRPVEVWVLVPFAFRL